MKKRKIKPFSKRALAAMKRAHRKWQNDPEVKAMREAIRRSTEITGDDLKIIVR